MTVSYDLSERSFRESNRSCVRVRISMTLDIDDVRIVADGIRGFRENCNEGADMTIGSMARTDKSCNYPTIIEGFCIAQCNNVWQHLRTSQKYSFDATRESYF